MEVGWGGGNEVFLFLPAMVFCNSPQSLDALMWFKEQAVVTWICCYCSLICKESWHGCSVSTVFILYYLFFLFIL